MEKFYKTLVEFGNNKGSVLELDIERTWKDDVHHAYGLGLTGIASLIISWNLLFAQD